MPSIPGLVLYLLAALTGALGTTGLCLWAVRRIPHLPLAGARRGCAHGSVGGRTACCRLRVLVPAVGPGRRRRVRRGAARADGGGPPAAPRPAGSRTDAHSGLR